MQLYSCLPDIATSDENSDTYFKTGNAFAFFNTDDNGDMEVVEKTFSDRNGLEVKAARVAEQKNIFLKFLQVIPATSKNSEGAMIFLNELYKNKALVNTLYRGVEGVDWKYNDKNQVEKIRKDYHDNAFFFMMFGNYFLSDDTVVDKVGTVKKKAEISKTVGSNRSLDFYFKPEKVGAQYAAVQNVISEYSKGLEYGILDPEKELPKFISKLKAAGIEDIIAEKQSQLNEWVKVNGK